MDVDSSLVPDYTARARLDGRRYVVVGAGQGIGRQTCHALAQSGAAQVLCVDAEESRAVHVAAEIGVGVPWHGDITTRDEVDRLLADAEERLGRVDGLVDIVGGARALPPFELDDDVWDAQLDLNLRHVYRLSQRFGKHMVDRSGGSIVVIASIAGIYGSPASAAYAATKAAVISWVKSLAVVLGESAVRVNAVAPGVTLTPRMAEVWDDATLAAIAAQSPLQRVGLPADIAGGVLYLLSDLASYVTGETLVVGGGVDARGPYQVP